MTKGLHDLDSEKAKIAKRRVVHRAAEPVGNAAPNTPERHASTLTRQVSHDGFVSIDNEVATDCPSKDRVSPVRCLADFDRIVSKGEIPSRLHNICTTPKKIATDVPSMPNPLHNHLFLSQHAHALRLEVELHPMRLILGRLMAHVSLNRKGLFNAPVDPVALGLPDYFEVVKTPMDLGTIRNKLHSSEYKSRADVVSDIRLCFENAMLYNHSSNFVHQAAQGLLDFFEEQLDQFSLGSEDLAAPRLPTMPASSSSMDGNSSSCFLPPVTLASTSTQPDAKTSVHITSRRGKLAPPEEPVTLQRKKRKPTIHQRKHNCRSCKGKICSICSQGCLNMEPALLVCSGSSCAGKRIPKGAVYHIAPDGSCQYCQRCYSGLGPILPKINAGDESVCRYKRELLKRRNEEEIVEPWISCSRCYKSFHQICAMFNPWVHSDCSYVCPECVTVGFVDRQIEAVPVGGSTYSFVSGSALPVPSAQLGVNASTQERVLDANSLPEDSIATFIQRKVEDLLKASDYANAAKTVTVRVVSDCEKQFKVPAIIQRHFKLSRAADGTSVSPPAVVPYSSKAIMLFQRLDGIDVCIFCMYVHEYDETCTRSYVEQEKRVYVAYLDSVEFFRPRSCRTQVYHEIITAYLATAKKRGFKAAHIWACPPSRGNSFVFWNHPASQRTPTMERLTSWYHAALSRAAQCGVVLDVKSLYESDFEEPLSLLSKSSGARDGMRCPPLIEGDFWIEEAARVHSLTFHRCSKELLTSLEGNSPWPEVSSVDQPNFAAASLIRKIMMMPSSLAFRRPVNAAAMKLKNYHTIIQHPMDLSTVHTKCLLGEYAVLRDFVNDVQLIFSNAKKFNPPQNIVHVKAVELECVFFTELESLAKSWRTEGGCTTGDSSWTDFERKYLGLNHSSSQEPCAPSDTENRPAGTEDSVVNHLSIMEGPYAIQRLMSGSGCNGKPDGKQAPSQNNVPNKNKRKSITSDLEVSVLKRRRQTWLGEEVAQSVCRIRTSVFKCVLDGPPSTQFDNYSEQFVLSSRVSKGSPVFDARCGLLEFSQYRHLEFDTLRRAKYSSSILLYHLHNRDAPGMVPLCSGCDGEIQGVRWHFTKRKNVTHSAPIIQRDLCSRCFQNEPSQMSFIPLPVSLERQ